MKQHWMKIFGMAVMAGAGISRASAFQMDAPAPPAPPEPPAPFISQWISTIGANTSYLGVGVEEVDGERARALKLHEEYGVEVTRIDDDSPATRAGLKAGDVILQYNGERVEGIEQFQRLVRETPAGRDVKLLVSRNGAPQTVPVKIGSRKADLFTAHGNGNWFALNAPDVRIPEIHIPEFQMPDIPQISVTMRTRMLGIEAEELTPQLAEFFGVKEGVLVRSVNKDSAAEKAGIKAGDVITKVDQNKISSTHEISSAIHSAREKKNVPVELVRDRHPVNVTVVLEDSRESHSINTHNVSGERIHM